MKWQGVNARGLSTGGSYGSGISPEKLARVKFKAGYRTLEISREGFVVGGIGPHPETGVRTWWGEK